MSTIPSDDQHDELPPTGQPVWMQKPYAGATDPAAAPQEQPTAGHDYSAQHDYSAPQGYQGYQSYQSQPGYPGGPQGYPGQAGYPGRPWAQQDPNAKSRMAAGLLGIFLGSLGIHRFYLGYTGIGVAMLLITVLSLGLLSWVSGIWGLVEGILYLTDKTGSYSRDATGRPLRD